MKKFLNTCLLIVSLVWLTAWAMPVRAIGSLIDANILAETDCVQAGDTTCEYSVSTFMKLGINVANIILGLVGALALVVFIYGGVRMLTSGGNAEAVTTGKKSIMGAVVGMVLVFGSYTIIRFSVNSLLNAESGYQFTGEINSTEVVGTKTKTKTTKAGDCTAKTSATESANCVKLGQCFNGTVTGKTEQCVAGEECCLTPITPNLKCEDNQGDCFVTTCLGGRHIDTRYYCPKGPVGESRHCCVLDKAQ